ncbi:hypothetical protein ACH49M_08980 [Rhodococcus qingshengii]|uniref:hypothetical protein n=2 Tax=Bacillati TaxID=1783272 RepID=UPI0036F5B9F0
MTNDESSAKPPRPEPPVLDPSDKRTALVERLQSVLAGLPSFFEFDNHFSGVNATDLHALNTLLGASIEGQVVKALNLQRPIWDPDDEWLGYTFERQSQTFPDVRLVRKGDKGKPDIGLGIELKGWFLLAKEGEPSFRFTTSAKACADHDLLVVLPWYLDNVLSGSPVAAEPFVASARWAAEYRNYYWQHMRNTKGDTAITSPEGAIPYPDTSDMRISDHPAYDGGGNFGRVARVSGMMDDFIRDSNNTEVLGIRIGDWHSFLRMHSDQADLDTVSAKMRIELEKRVSKISEKDASFLISTLLLAKEILKDV